MYKTSKMDLKGECVSAWKDRENQALIYIIDTLFFSQVFAESKHVLQSPQIPYMSIYKTSKIIISREVYECMEGDHVLVYIQKTGC